MLKTLRNLISSQGVQSKVSEFTSDPKESVTNEKMKWNPKEAG